MILHYSHNVTTEPRAFQQLRLISFFLPGLLLSYPVQYTIQMKYNNVESNNIIRIYLTLSLWCNEGLTYTSFHLYRLLRTVSISW